MKIEDVEELWQDATADSIERKKWGLEQAFQALRAEAWHPIEKAEELGGEGWEIRVVMGRNVFA